MMMQLLALPIMLVLMAIWGSVVLLLVGPDLVFSKLSAPAGNWGAYLLCGGFFFLLIPLHELLHALVHPGWGFSPKTIIGFWLSKGLFYAHYDGIMSRNRFLLILLAPYLVLGVMATFATAAFPEWRFVFLAFSFWGSILPCGDFVGVLIVLFQIPARAIVQNKGWKTFWKPAS